MTNGATGQIVFQSTSSSQVFSNVVGNCSVGASIDVESGTYLVDAQWTVANVNGITLNFESGAVLFVSNGLNAAALWLRNCNNWLIQGVTINGNMANQASAAGSGHFGMSLFGILIIGGSNIEILNANITQCGQYGVNIVAATPEDGVVNCGIINSTFTFCGWNGIQLGNNYPTSELNLYAINNTVAYCGDVGITNFGVENTVQGNYVYDMNGTLGSVNSEFGIAVEGGGSDLITQNTIEGCSTGISVGPWNNCTISDNIVQDNTLTSGTYTPEGIVIYGSHNSILNNHVSGNANNQLWLVGATYNLISGNYFSYSPASCGINLDGTSNYNTVSLNNAFDNNAMGIWVYGSNNYISQNQVYSDGVAPQWDGIYINSGATSNVLSNNNVYGNTNLQIADSGTYTVTNAIL